MRDLRAVAWHRENTRTSMQKDLQPKKTVTYKPGEDAVTVTAEPTVVYRYVLFEVPSALAMKSTIFWHAICCWLV
jgi:hypothetical protein